MKTTMITEFVKFNLQETTTNEQLFVKADSVIIFLKKQDGYINAELVKDIKENEWYFVFHFENLEKVKVIGENLRSSKEFGEFISVIVPGSLGVTLHHQLRKW